MTFNSDRFLDLAPADVPGGMYHLMNAIIAPRPIAWISTISPTGVFNLAPHSYTTVLSPNPPIVGFVSIGRKDSLRNVEAAGDFVYHIADEGLAEALNRSAADFPSNISEFDWAGLTAIESDLVKSPRVLQAPVAMEAKVVEIKQITTTNNFLVMGEVVRVHLCREVMTGPRVDPVKLRPLGRLAGSGFSRLGDLFSLDRPTYSGLLESGAEPFPTREG